jgi:DNA-directed RNA polymerase
MFPVLFKTTTFVNDKRKEVYAPNTNLNKITSTLSNYTLISARDLPMLVPPFPWNSAEGFPFLISKSFLVIEPSVIYERQISEKLRKFNINATLDSLNYTSLTPWKINTEIFDLLVKIFQSGGDYKLDIPHHFSKMPQIPKKEPDDNPLAYKKKIFEIKKQNREMYSLWCEMNYKLSIANYVSLILDFLKLIFSFFFTYF